MPVGTKIAELITKKNISQKEFAKKLSIAPSTLNGYVKCTREPDYEMLKKIADYFNVSCDFLLESNVANYSKSLPINKLKPIETRVVSLFKSLDPSQKEIVLELMKLMYKQKK